MAWRAALHRRTAPAVASGAGMKRGPLPWLILLAAAIAAACGDGRGPKAGPAVQAERDTLAAGRLLIDALQTRQSPMSNDQIVRSFAAGRRSYEAAVAFFKVHPEIVRVDRSGSNHLYAMRDGDAQPLAELSGADVAAVTRPPLPEIIDGSVTGARAQLDFVVSHEGPAVPGMFKAIAYVPGRIPTPVFRGDLSDAAGFSEAIAKSADGKLYAPIDGPWYLYVSAAP